MCFVCTARYRPASLTRTDKINNRRKMMYGCVSTANRCQTAEASNLCIYDAVMKLTDYGDYDIGGTYSEFEPEFWFFFTSTVCHGNNYLLNLFVCHRKTGKFTIEVSNSNVVTVKANAEAETQSLVLPYTLTAYRFKSTKPNQNHFIKTFCFKDMDSYSKGNSMLIPLKIIANPKFSLDSNIVKSMKLQHDLSSLLTKQEITDFVLVSSSQKQFPTHKIVLAAHSPVLRNMLRNTEVNSLFIDISDNDMELFLQFIYTGTIQNILKQDCLKLLEIADKFELKQLGVLSQHVTIDQINENNAIDMAKIAKKYRLEELLNKVCIYIINHPKVMTTQSWRDLDDVELAKVLIQYMQDLISC